MFTRPALLSLLLVSCLLLPVDCRVERRGQSDWIDDQKIRRQSGHNVQKWREEKSEANVAMFTVIDFNEDSDHEPDAEGQYTEAILGKDKKATFPPSFTVCAAYKIDVWNTEWNAIRFFELLDNGGYYIVYLGMYCADAHTEFSIYVKSLHCVAYKTTEPTFPLQCTMG
jgi:hypothetical protein